MYEDKLRELAFVGEASSTSELRRERMWGLEGEGTRQFIWQDVLSSSTFVIEAFLHLELLDWSS